MKSIHVLLGFVFLLVAAEFSGCVDHLDPSVPPGSSSNRLRVKTLTQALPADPAVSRPDPLTNVSSFNYDGQGRLSTISTHQQPNGPTSWVETTTYQYNAQNHLMQLKRDVIKPNNQFNASETYELSYNSAGQVSELRYPGAGIWQIKPTYTTDNQLTAVSKSYITGGLTYIEQDTYLYTGKNLTYSSFNSKTEAKQTTFLASGNEIYTYDTKVNPFYGIYIIPAPGNPAGMPTGGIFKYYTYYGGIANILNLSQNNQLTRTGSSNTKTTYTYTYNANDLPTSRVTTDDNMVTETLMYEYETY